MTCFYWRGIAPSGELRCGQKIARRRCDVLQDLYASNITPIYIRRDLGLLQTNALKPKLLNFIEQLAFSLSAHVSLSEAFHAQLATEKNERLLPILEQIQSDVEAGKSLSEALLQFPELLDIEYAAFIKMGESTGQLPTTLMELTRLKKNQKQHRQHIKKALTYPIFLLISSLCLSLGMVFFIIPQYQHFFFEQHSSLPALTRLLLTAANTLDHAALPGLTSFVLTSALIHKLLKNARFAQTFHRALLHTPFIGKLLLYQTLRNWSYLLTLACRTHLPLLSALTLAHHTVTNPYLKRRFSALIPALSAGASLEESLSATLVFTPPLLQMIAIGENTGNLAPIFQQVTTHYETLLNIQLTALAEWAQPILLLLLAAFTGILIAALYLPMIHLGLHL